MIIPQNIGCSIMRGLVIGRYQPFHLGHLEVMREIMADPECSELIIAIGSAQESHTKTNPFTAGERILMINCALRDVGISEYFLIPIMDVNRYAVWVSHVESLVPKIDIVYTNNQLTRRLFSERGYNVKLPKLYDRNQYSGTKIRDLILTDGDWSSLVPESVAKIIEEIDGINRLKGLN
jgi:nicotinamide-nucleotide adenylyltransferase